jgi:hypothetical protein
MHLAADNFWVEGRNYDTEFGQLDHYNPHPADSSICKLYAQDQ